MTSNSLGGMLGHMSQLKLRPASMADAALLLTWRNDPLTRAMSRNAAKVAPSEHCAWLENALADPARTLYIAELDGVPVGTLRADTRRDGTTELSWTVAPAARGKGVGRRMVAELASRLTGPIRARIKAANAASVRIAEQVGMQLERDDGEVLHFVRR